jgi:serine protease Do
MNRSLRSPALWTLLAGFAVGVASVASIFTESPLAVGTAHAEPEVHLRATARPNTPGMSALRELDSALADLAEYAAPAVVHLKSESRRSSDVFGQMAPSGGEGSGFIFRPDGYIITNDHVVGGFDKVTVVLNDGREFIGTVIRAEDSDIAVVKIDATDLPSLAFADSTKVRPGQMCMAIGSPFGFENSVTVGHVSALGRMNAIADPRLGRDRGYYDLIQTDAPINMGNSGGPLMSVDGQVVGINTSIFSPTGVNMGIGFAIPSNQARFIAETLIEKGKVVRAYLGVAPESLKEFQKKEMNLPGGALLMEVRSDEPAAIAGLKEGDVVVRIGTYPVNDQMDLRNVMLRYEPGQTVPVEVVRNGERKTFQVKLAEPKPVVRPQPQQRMPRTPEFPNFQDIPELREFRGRLQEEDVPPLRSGNARLGVTVDSITANHRKQFNIPEDVQGAVVTAIEPNSVAQREGIQVGDVIQEVGDMKIDGAPKLVEAMQGVRWGQARRIRIGRYGENSQFLRTYDVRFE